MFSCPRPDLGATLSGALHDVRFWLILVAFFLATVAINGTLVHVVPMLTDRGVPVPQAVDDLLAGVVLIVGR